MFHCFRIVKICSPVTPLIRFNSSDASLTKVVYKSLSTNIYTNLAIEDWFYQNHNFEQSQILLLYRNDPCVVIGRHQNPWTEANVPFLRNNGVSLARRNSGGGTVFHDQGNLNFSFMTSKSEYNRAKNLNTICAGLKNVLDIDVSVNCRDDIVINGIKKVSGTAAKIGRKSAYHHCTLLVNVDTTKLHEALNNPASGIIETNATKSIRSPIENISSHNHLVDITMIENAIAAEFGVHELIEIVPNNLEYDGLQEIVEMYQSWDWIYGKSPKFSIASGETKIHIVNGKVSMEYSNEMYRFDEEFPSHLERTGITDLVELANIITKLV